MSERTENELDIFIDLEAIAPHLVGKLGDAGYAKLSQKLRDDLTRFLTTNVSIPNGYRLEPTPLRPASGKGAFLALSAISVLLSAGIGYAYDAAKTRQIVEGIWAILRKLIPEAATVDIKTAGGATWHGRASTTEELRLLLHDSAPMLVDRPRERQKSRRRRDITLRPDL